MPTMNLSQFGSFGAGAEQAVRAALAKRQQGEGTPALQQQGQTSPTASTLPPEPTSGVAPTASSMNAGGETAGQVGNPEARLIVSGLKERLKAISDVEKVNMGIR